MKNKGFSLIELIVTVAILAISSVLVVSSFSSVQIKNMQKCAAELDALISQSRVGAMSRAGDVYLELRQGTDGIYAAYCESGGGTDLREEEKIGKSMLSVGWTDSSGITHDLSDGNLYLAFDRSTGALLPLSRSFAMAGESGADTDCIGITVYYGENSRTVVLIPVTGKHHVTAN